MTLIKLKPLQQIAFYICFIFSIGSLAQETKIDAPWKQYLDVEEAGFSVKKLNLVKAKLDSTNTASLLVVHNGKILLSYGDNTRRFMIHSIRKSIMNAMIGIEIEKGTLNLNQTLRELNIDDIGKLTDIEKEATIKDLLSACSGIYHPSAYSTRSMIKNLPERGSHEPGTFWYYNNWDFNVLFTIYEQQSGKKFFEAFKNEIANPIGMEDFKIEHTFYRTEKDKSLHPAYLFRMSARDMARFGQLYLEKGTWNKKSILSSKWIEKSTQSVSTDLGNFSSKGNYGLLWWVSSINNKKMYYASGSGGQRIIIFPEENIVIVHRVNTYENNAVGTKEINEMVSQVLNAQHKVQKNNPNPRLKLYNPAIKSFPTIFNGSMDQYLGTYKHRFLGEMTIKKSSQGYVLQNGVGVFKLYPLSKNTFYPEDIENLIVMEKTTEDSKKYKIEPKFADDKSITKVIFYY